MPNLGSLFQKVQLLLAAIKPVLKAPGGWQIIVIQILFDINAASPCAIEPGDTLEFVIQEVLK